MLLGFGNLRKVEPTVVKFGAVYSFSCRKMLCVDDPWYRKSKLQSSGAFDAQSDAQIALTRSLKDAMYLYIMRRSFVKLKLFEGFLMSIKAIGQVILSFSRINSISPQKFADEL